jgi:hypothetical protein
MAGAYRPTNAPGCAARRGAHQAGNSTTVRVQEAQRTRRGRTVRTTAVKTPDRPRPGPRPRPQHPGAVRAADGAAGQVGLGLAFVQHHDHRGGLLARSASLTYHTHRRPEANWCWPPHPPTVHIRHSSAGHRHRHHEHPPPPRPPERRPMSVGPVRRWLRLGSRQCARVTAGSASRGRRLGRGWRPNWRGREARRRWGFLRRR